MAQWLDPYGNIAQYLENTNTKCEEDGSAIVFSLTSERELALPNFLQLQRSCSHLDHEQLLLLFYDFGTLFVNLEDISHVAEIWDMPKALLNFTAIKRVPMSNVSLAVQSCPVKRLIWHSCPLRVPGDPGERKTNVITFMYSIPKAEGNEVPDDSPPPSAVLFCPKRLKPRVESRIRYYRASTEACVFEYDSRILGLIILILEDVIVFDWVATLNKIIRRTGTLLSRNYKSRTELLSGEIYWEARKLISQIHRDEFDLEELRMSIHHLEQIVSASPYQDSIFLSALSFYERKISEVSRYFAYMRRHLEYMDRKLTDIVQANNAQYLRTNIIEMRRLAEQNDRKSGLVRHLAQQSAEDAREMKRLAYLTMFFLPTTVVAAFFSTPFLELDNNMTFRALPKIWLLLVPSIILTAVTFATSAAWDFWRCPNAQVVDEEDFQSDNAGTGLLEPSGGCIPSDFPPAVLEIDFDEDEVGGSERDSFR